MEDALLTAIQKEVVLHAGLASAEAAFVAARVRTARMMYTTSTIKEERTSSALFICTNGDVTEKATIAANRTDPEWILDSGASQHVAGDFSEFESYDELTPSQSKMICTADGTSQPINGIGTVQCVGNTP